MARRFPLKDPAAVRVQSAPRAECTPPEECTALDPFPFSTLPQRVVCRSYIRRLYVVASWMVYVRFRARLLFPHPLLPTQLLLSPHQFLPR